MLGAISLWYLPQVQSSLILCGLTWLTVGTFIFLRRKFHIYPQGKSDLQVYKPSQWWHLVPQAAHSRARPQSPSWSAYYPLQGLAHTTCTPLLLPHTAGSSSTLFQSLPVLLQWLLAGCLQVYLCRVTYVRRRPHDSLPDAPSWRPISYRVKTKLPSGLYGSSPFNSSWLSGLHS